MMGWIKSSAALIVAGLLFAGFLANLIVGKLAIMQGATQLPGLGDVGEFVLLLLTVLFFIVGCLQREAAAANNASTPATNDAANDPRPQESNRET